MPSEYEYMLSHGDGYDDQIDEEIELWMRMQEDIEDAATL